MRDKSIVAITAILVLPITACNVSTDVGPLGTDDNQPYVTCAVPVVTGIAEVLDEIMTKSESGDVEGYCNRNVRWEQRAEDMMDAHAKCPEPEDMDLRDAARNIDHSLNELDSGIAYSHEFCSAWDTDAWGLAIRDVWQAGHYLGEATEAMYRFGVPEVPALDQLAPELLE